MSYRYLIFSELQKKINMALKESDPFFITTVSDLITVIEINKKNGSQFGCKEICSSFDQQVNSGRMFLAEVDRHNLLYSLFEDGIWSSLTNRRIDPLHIIRHLSLKKYNDAIWWDDEIYNEMKSLFDEVTG